MREKVTTFISRRWWVIPLAIVIAGITDLGRSGTMSGAFVFAYWAFIIFVPFGMVGALLVGTLASLNVIPERHRLTVCVLAGYLVVAAYVGLFVYLAVPAHDILGWDHARGMNDSLWQMHGEEMLLAEHSPGRYAAITHQIWHDRLTFLTLWSVWATSIGLVVRLVTHGLKVQFVTTSTRSVS